MSYGCGPAASWARKATEAPILAHFWKRQARCSSTFEYSCLENTHQGGLPSPGPWSVGPCPGLARLVYEMMRARIITMIAPIAAVTI